MCVRVTGEMVYSLSESFIPFDRFSKIGSFDLMDKFLGKVLNRFVIYLKIVSQRVNTRMANYSEIEYLNISNPAVVMVVNNMAY